MPKLNLRALLEAFPLGAGIPPSVWRTVPVHKVPVIQGEARIRDVIVKSHIEEFDAPFESHSEEGNLDE